MRAAPRYMSPMDRSAALIDAAEPSVSQARALWLAATAVATLAVAAFALWARYGSAVFVDALGVVASCF